MYINVKARGFDGENVAVFLDYIIMVKPTNQFNISVIITPNGDLYVMEPYEDLMEKVDEALKKLMYSQK